MPEISGYGDIDSFDIIETIGSFISDNVIDIRTDRKNIRWIFPTLPKDRTNYPEAVVEIKNITYDDQSADMYLNSETLVGGNYVEYYGRSAMADVLITVLTEKESQFTVQRNGESLFLTNQPLNLYIINQISDAIKWYKSELLEDFVDVRVIRKTPVFEDAPQTWASELRIEIDYQDVWAKEYSASGELLTEYSLTITTY
jgi:hypothetical protein